MMDHLGGFLANIRMGLVKACNDQHIACRNHGPLIDARINEGNITNTTKTHVYKLMDCIM